METQWGVMLANGSVFECRDRKHAEGMMISTSVVLGPKRGRKIVLRQVTPWGEA